MAVLAVTISSVTALGLSTSVAVRSVRADGSATISPGTFALNPSGGTAAFTVSIPNSTWTDTPVNLSYGSSGPAFTGPSSVTIPAGQTAATASASYGAGYSGASGTVSIVQDTPVDPTQALWAD